MRFGLALLPIALIVFLMVGQHWSATRAGAAGYLCGLALAVGAFGAGTELLAVAHMALGDLARVRRVVKLLGMVNAAPDFGEHPKVINGCSDLFVNVLGEAGRHARSAVGMGSLPGRMTVEIEAILQVDG